MQNPDDIITTLREVVLLGSAWDSSDFEDSILYFTRQLVQTRRKGQKRYFGFLNNGKTSRIAAATFVMGTLKCQKVFQEKQNKARSPLIYRDSESAGNRT